MKRLYSVLIYSLLALALPVVAFGALHPDVILSKIAQRCRESNTDSLLIAHKGRLIFEYRSGNHEIQRDIGAITQSIAGLAIAFLIEERKIDSFDVRISCYYPEWNREGKDCITLRHILTQTSGLHPAYDDDDLNKILDIVQYALSADSVYAPGCRLVPNNKVVNLIGGIVQKVSGKNIKDYLTEKLFCPLGINEVLWVCDPTGHEYCMSHLLLKVEDLLKIGQMLGNGGRFEGQQILHPHLINALLRPGQTLDPSYGFLWHLDFNTLQCFWDEKIFEEYRCNQINEDCICKLKCLGEHVHPVHQCTCNLTETEISSLLDDDKLAQIFCSQVASKNLPIARWRVGTVSSFSSYGDKGQQLIVWPSKQLIAVRLVPPNCDFETLDCFADLKCLLEQLAYCMDM